MSKKANVILTWFVVKINGRTVDCTQQKDAPAAFDYAIDRWANYAQRALREGAEAIIEVDVMPEKKAPVVLRASTSDIAKYGIGETPEMDKTWPYAPIPPYNAV